MASNLTLPGTGNIVATEEVNGAQVQIVKLTDSTVSVNTSALATSANQTSQVVLETTLNSLIETLQELVQRLAPLSGAMANTAQLRTVVTGAVTASGPITSAQSIAEKAPAGISYPEKIALDNLTVAITNTNNCVGV